LVKEVQQGNANAFEEIVNKYQKKIERTIYGILGDSEEAEDVGQETFIRFFKAINKFRGESSVGTYLTRIAINLSLNALKKRKRKLEIENALKEKSALNYYQDNENEKVENKEIIRQAIDVLPSKYKEVIVLRLMNNYSTEETAKVLQLPIGTVLSRLFRGQEKLRATLAPHFGGAI